MTSAFVKTHRFRTQRVDPGVTMGPHWLINYKNGATLIQSVNKQEN